MLSVSKYESSASASNQFAHPLQLSTNLIASSACARIACTTPVAMIATDVSIFNHDARLEIDCVRRRLRSTRIVCPLQGLNVFLVLAARENARVRT